VPVKKTRKPAAAVKYLLSGDRKLQRLSLKKIANPVKNAKPKTRSSRVKQATGEEPAAARSPKHISGRVVIVGVVCLFTAAALLAARQPAALPDDASTATAPDAATASQPSIPAANTQRTPAAIEKTPALAPVKKTRTAKAVASPNARESIAPVKSSSPFTVEGCLESDGSTYRLKDVSGLDAPKARSWRTGFLMKRSSSVELVDTTGRLKFGDHVGTRVAATGLLADRELRATALRQVSASCR